MSTKKMMVGTLKLMGIYIMSRIGNYLLDRLENGELYEDIITKGVNNENSQY